MDERSEVERRPYGGESGCGLRAGGAIFLAGLGALLLVGAVVVFGLYRAGANLVRDPLGALSNQPTPVIQTRAVILQQLQGASELATAIFTMETVVDESEDRTLGSLVIGRTRLLFVAHGQVRAGVDLAELAPEDLTVVTDTVTIHLPPPRLLDQKIDVDRSYVYDLDQSLLGPVSPDLQSRAERFALQKIVEGACEGGILEEATERAKVTVKSLLEAAGFVQVDVLVQPPAPDACPRPTPGSP